MMTAPYHTLKEFVHKVDVMHKKSKDLALLKDTAPPQEVKYMIEDIQAVAREIANDKTIAENTE